jgi:DNA invertase Pin-like site-specific DNA recombinase
MGESLIYARVSTVDQDLDHQEQNLWEYATDELGIPDEEITVLDDTSTGTDVDRPGYRDLLARVRDGDVDRVIVREVTRLGRTMREISEDVHEIVEDHDTGLFVRNDPIEVKAGEELTMQDQMLLNVLAWAAELEAKKLRENTIAGLRAAEAQGKWVGRPPFGFSTDADGHLQPNENYAKAVRAIRAVEDLDWSDRKASNYTGVPRRTVPNIVDRKSLYLNEYDASTVDEIEPDD